MFLRREMWRISKVMHDLLICSLRSLRVGVKAPSRLLLLWVVVATLESSISFLQIVTLFPVDALLVKETSYLEEESLAMAEEEVASWACLAIPCAITLESFDEP
jgi:hypothetical protein